MLLRWLVSNYLRQTAEETLREAASEVLTRKPAEASDSAAADEPSGCDVAVLFALPIESAGLVDQLKDLRTARVGDFVEHSGIAGTKQIVVAETGVGLKAAAKAAADVISFHQPRWIISAGFAGGLQDEIRPGHLLLADSVADTSGQSLSIGLQCDRQWLATAKGVHAGRLLTVDKIIRTAAEKEEIGKQHSAIACDMETFAVADVCREQGTRFIAIRVITDAVDDTLPPEVDRLMRQKTLAGKFGAAAGAIFTRPTVAKELWDLRGMALKASDRLAKFLVSTIEQLPE